VVSAVGVATRDQILESEQEVVELQPIPGGQQREVIDVGKKGFPVEIIYIDTYIKLVAWHGIHEMNGEVTAITDGEVEHAQDFPGPVLKYSAENELPAVNGASGAAVSNTVSAPTLTIEGREG
jgi:hypothetical protein